MGGYVREGKIILLEFEDEPGLEVRMRSVSIGMLRRLMGLAQLAEARTGEDAMKAMDTIINVFCKRIVSWNLQHEDLESGEVVDTPRTPAGLDEHDADFVFGMAMAWLNGLTMPSANLGKDSPDGKPSEDLLIPMDL